MNNVDNEPLSWFGSQHKRGISHDTKIKKFYKISTITPITTTKSEGRYSLSCSAKKYVGWWESESGAEWEWEWKLLFCLLVFLSLFFHFFSSYSKYAGREIKLKCHYKQHHQQLVLYLRFFFFFLHFKNFLFTFTVIKLPKNNALFH